MEITATARTKSEQGPNRRQRRAHEAIMRYEKKPAPPYKARMDAAVARAQIAAEKRAKSAARRAAAGPRPITKKQEAAQAALARKITARKARHARYQRKFQAA